MLVEFSVSNFRSIRDTQNISLVAGTGAELQAGNVMPSGAPATPDLLRSAVMYGPNASGKSNLLAALNTMRFLVLRSAQDGQQGEDIPVTPFLLDSGAMASRPTRFEIVFIEGGVRFQYGFEVTSKRVVAEWLLAYPKGQAQLWFERDVDQEPVWRFGVHLKGQKRLWQTSTRDNALFLSTAVQLNATQLMPVFDWFQKRLRSMRAGVLASLDFTAQRCSQDARARSKVLALLQAADLGVSGIDIEPREFDPSILPDDMPEEIRHGVIEDLKKRELQQVKLLHNLGDGKSVSLNIEEESDGTRKMFSLAGPLVDVLDGGRVLIIDELDTSLHPLLMRKLVELFHDPALNTNNAQLLFSTHDTSVLDKTLFRRDQVWFVERDRQYETRLYPLSDFSPRREHNLERGYLQGRYGALPWLGEWRL